MLLEAFVKTTNVETYSALKSSQHHVRCVEAVNEVRRESRRLLQRVD